MRKTNKVGACIPSHDGTRVSTRGAWFCSVLVVGVLSLAICGEAAAQQWIWWPAAGQTSEYGGAMSKSSTYAGGSDLDASANSLMPTLVYANSTSDSWSGGSGDTVTYWATLSSGSNWYLWARFYFPGAPGSNDGNSFWVSVDDGPRRIFGNNKNYYQKWHWGGDGSNEWAGLTPVSLGWLGAGWHKIVVEKREVNPAAPRLDAFCMTTESGYVPQDTHAAPALGVTIDDTPPPPPPPPATAPKLSVAPTSLTFASTVVGSTASAQSVMLSNTGDATLSVTGVSVGGTNAADFGVSASASYSIQPGASATFSVTFSPKSAGTRTAALSVVSNGGNASVSLTGTATAPTTPPPPPPASDPNEIYLSASSAPGMQLYGAMTSSTAYAGGSDLDTQFDSLCDKLLYANSTVNSWYNMTGDEVSYTVKLPTTGTWYLWARLYYPGRPGTNDANSFVAAVDNGKWYRLGDKRNQFQRFHWDGDGRSETATPIALKLGRLTAGTHTLRIRKREVTPIPPRIDVLYLSLSATKRPMDAAARTALGIGGAPVQTPGIGVTPTSMPFGNVAVGSTSAAQVVTVTNTGTAALSVSGVSITGAQASSFATTAQQTYTVQPAAKVTFNVTFAPKAAGAASAALEIASNAPTGKVSIALTGEGTTTPTPTPAAIAIDKTTLSFGTVNVGSTSAASVVNVTNTGGSELSISSVACGGTQASQFAHTASPTPIKLAAGGKTAVQCYFKPTTAGAASATLTIASSAGNKTVALSGTGQQVSSGSYANEGSLAGTNLTGIADYSSEWPFTDCYKMSRPMWSATQWAWSDSRSLDLDANGWPRSLQSGQWAKTIIFWDIPNMYPSGDYVVLYDGEGTLAYEYAATKVSSSPGRDVIRVDASKGGFGVSIATTNASNYLRNLRVIMPGCESIYQTEMFNPTFIESVKNFKVLRFMDWMETNGSSQVNWTDRPKATDAQWTRKGAPLEVICELANRLHADPWVCVPHRATDDYVRQMATLMKAQLQPGIRAWVEYSNEVWNWGFPQASYASQMGLSLGLTSDQYAAVFMYHSRRTVECIRIFESVFGDPTRLVRIMGAQSAGSWWSDQMLALNNAYEHIDAVAIAPYFGGYMGGSGDYSRIKGLGVDGTINELRTRALPEAYGWMDATAAVAGKYGIAMVAYEGGQHLVGVGAPMEDAGLNTLFDAVNRDPRMGQLYTDYLNYWKASGGDIFVHFNNAMRITKYGRWGSMEYLGQPRTQAPKYDAIQKYIEANRFQ